MYSTRHYESGCPTLGGTDFDKEDARELYTLDLDSMRTIKGLVLGAEAGGSGRERAANAKVHAELVRQGERWAQHVLEVRSCVLNRRPFFLPSETQLNASLPTHCRVPSLG